MYLEDPLERFFFLGGGEHSSLKLTFNISEMITGWEHFSLISLGREREKKIAKCSGCWQYESFYNSKLLGNLSCVRS